MKKILIAGLILQIFHIGCTSSCKKQMDTSKNQVGQAAALVNNKEVSLAKLNEWDERYNNQIKQTGRQVDPDLAKRMRASLLRKMIDNEILKQKAESMGINVDRFERTNALDQYKARMGGDQAFAAYLKYSKLSEEQVIETLVEDLTRDKLLKKLNTDSAANDAEIKAYYKNNESHFNLPPMVRASHILLKVQKTDPAEKQELILKKANKILEEAKAAPEKFADLVMKYSEEGNLERKGDLGFFPRGKMVKPFEEAAFSAPLKTPIGPIKTDFGYHIIYVEEKSEGRLASLEEVRPRIIESLAQGRLARQREMLLATLRKSSHVKILDESMSDKDYEEIISKNQKAEAKAE